MQGRVGGLGFSEGGQQYFVAFDGTALQQELARARSYLERNHLLRARRRLRQSGSSCEGSSAPSSLESQLLSDPSCALTGLEAELVSPEASPLPFPAGARS